MLNLFQHQKDYEINARNKLSVTKLKTPSPLERGYGGEAQINRINSVLRKFIGTGVRLIKQNKFCSTELSLRFRNKFGMTNGLRNDSRALSC